MHSQSSEQTTILDKIHRDNDKNTGRANESITPPQNRSNLAPSSPYVNVE